MTTDSRSDIDGVAGAPHVRLEASAIAASLTAGDLAASVAWYRDVVGFTVDREYARDGVVRAVALSTGPVKLLLTQDNGAKGLDRIKGEGFSLQFTTAQDVDALADAIVQRGGVLEAPPVDAMGARVFRLRDPDGFRLVVSAVRAAP